MNERRIRLIDCAAGLLWIVVAFLLLRGGFEGVDVLHVWGLATAAVALTTTCVAVASTLAKQVIRAVHHRALDDLVSDVVRFKGR